MPPLAAKLAPADQTCLREHPRLSFLRDANPEVMRGSFLFGTDSPPLIPLKLPALKMMDQIGMTPAQRESVMDCNAARLLKLK
jgi:predicted TIM-barrel fold metal-dependent hydrolase